MIRIPNPVTDLIRLRDIYSVAFFNVYEAVGHPKNGLGHDDMRKLSTKHGFITSQGGIGPQASERSYREDRSLDAVFNQTKMLTELWRLFGWIIPLPDTHGRFIPTLIGKQISKFTGIAFDSIKLNDVTVNEKDILKHNLLNLVFPNPHTDANREHSVRPFLSTLRLAKKCGGFLHRDEIILTIYQMKNDRDEREFRKKIENINQFRQGKVKIDDELKKLARKENLKLSTMRNYTRVLINAGREVGWFEKTPFNTLSEDMKKMYQNAFGSDPNRKKFERLTKEGEKTLSDTLKLKDIRKEDLRDLSKISLVWLIRLGNVLMKSRVGFPLELSESDKNEVEDLLEELEKISISWNLDFEKYFPPSILFEPFQQIESKILIGEIRGKI